MKICAITMVHRDHWALAQWYRHYAAMLGPEHLYIVAHGADPQVAELCPGASIITIPRDDLDGFERKRIRFLHGLQSGFVRIYDWVIRTDADELVCVDPAHHASLQDLLAAHGEDEALFALGLDLVEQDDDPPFAGHEPVFSRRRIARANGHYSKAFAARTDMALAWHGVQVRPRLVDQVPFVLPRGVYLVHLKYANTHAMEEANEVRVEVAQVAGVSDKWRKAPQRTQGYLREARALPMADFAQHLGDVYDYTLENIKRDTRKGVVRAQSVKFGYLTRLPDWFAAG